MDRMDRMDRIGIAIALGDVPNRCMEMGWFHGNDCWWVVETRAWVPAFAGMTEGAGVTGWGVCGKGCL